MTSLKDQLMAAHTAGDGAAMVRLYIKVAEQAVDPKERAFFLTQAHVFALETAHPETANLRAQLVQMGRETPL